MKTEILKELKGTDGYVSGQELCEKFGVSRTAVWKVINQLKEEGYDIEAVRNKGYRLASSGDLLSREEIVTSIRGQWAGRQVEYLQEVDSTNTFWWWPSARPWERAAEAAAGFPRRGPTFS